MLSLWQGAEKGYVLMIKATTQHGTYYLIDDENGRAKRVRGEFRNKMYGDSEWFDFIGYHPVDRSNWTHGESGIEIGKAIFFYLPRPFGDWRASTNVVSVEEV